MATPVVTLTLIAINFLIFGAMISGINLDEFAFVPAETFAEPWTFVTATFMHASVEHILFNMFALFMFGVILESYIGKSRYLIFYLAAGIIGNFVQMAMAYSGIFPSHVPGVDSIFIPGVGASGAIMGILGVLGLTHPRLPIYIMFLPIPVPMYIGVIFFAIFNIALSFIATNIGTGAHLGGLALGILLGIFLRHAARRRREMQIRYIWRM
jgi:membrane associated rhomboid family serine protease